MKTSFSANFCARAESFENMAAQPRLKTEVTPPDKKKSIILLRRDMFLVFFFSQCLAVAKTAEIDLDLSKIVKLFAGELWEETTTS